VDPKTRAYDGIDEFATNPPTRAQRGFCDRRLGQGALFFSKILKRLSDTGISFEFDSSTNPDRTPQFTIVLARIQYP
jgi:hypothetical protein